MFFFGRCSSGLPSTQLEVLKSTPRSTNPCAFCWASLGYIVRDSAVSSTDTLRGGSQACLDQRAVMASACCLPNAGCDSHQTASPQMHTHTVRFYKTSQFLCADVADFLCRGLAQGYAAIAVIMKESHEALLIQQLTQRGFAVPLLIAAGQLVLADCADLLPRFMDCLLYTSDAADE